MFIIGLRSFWRTEPYSIAFATGCIDRHLQ
jgi:hypothetical protein